MRFKNLRRKSTSCISQILVTPIEPTERPVVTYNEQTKEDSQSGFFPTEDGRLIVCSRSGCIILGERAVKILQEIAADAHRFSDFNRVLSERAIMQATAESLCENHAALTSCSMTADQLMGQVFDCLLKPPPTFTVITPVLGLIPARGVLEIGGIRISRPTPEFLENLRTAATHEASPVRDPSDVRIERDPVREYGRHSIARIPCEGEIGNAVEQARHRLDLVLGAIRFYVVASLIDAEKFQFRAFGELWYSPLHYARESPEGRVAGIGWSMRVHYKPVVVDSETIQITSTPHFSEVDRVLGSKDPEQDLNPLERRLRQFLFWFGRAQDSSRRSDSFLKLFVCLETLFDVPDLKERESIPGFVGLYHLHLLQDPDEARRLRKDLLTLYRLRNSIVHTGASEVKEGQLRTLYGAAALGFWLFTSLLWDIRLTSPLQLRDWFRQYQHFFDK
jgi:hypothetical protein